MIQAYYEFCHGIGLHLWDLPALIVFVFAVIYLVVHRVKQSKRQKKFEKQLEELEQNSEELENPAQA